jgi:hypothetical protein
VNNPCICVIDGQGGGIGSVIVRALRNEFGSELEVIALGTNAIATTSMMKAGANRGASGDDAIMHSVNLADFVLGPLGIVMANSMMGEMTPAAAAQVASCRARKMLLPLNQENTEVVGVVREPLPHLVEEMVRAKLRRYLNHV